MIQRTAAIFLPRIRTVSAIVIYLFSFALTASGQQPAWREITIDSRWGGLGPSENLKLVLESRNGVIYLGKDVVNPKLVDALPLSLSSPSLPAPALSNLGVTSNWLERNAAEIPRDGEPNQRALFQKSFADPKTAEELLPFAFQFTRFDDYPHLTLTVAFANGRRWVCSSDSYYPFMLPWKLNLNGSEQVTYNANISRALAALMPAGSLNRNRLNDDELRTWLTDAVMTRIKEQWDVLGVENRAPESFAVLRRGFEVQHARINPYRSVDYRYVGNEKAHMRKICWQLCDNHRFHRMSQKMSFFFFMTEKLMAWGKSLTASPHT
jgi:hypothetical protein